MPRTDSRASWTAILGSSGTLHRKCFVLIAAFSAFILLATSIFFVVGSERSLKAQFMEQGREEVENLAQSLRNGLVIEDAGSLEQAIDVSLDDRDVVFISVYDNAHHLLFTKHKPGTDADALGRQLRADSPAWQDPSASELVFQELVRDSGGKPIGRVDVGRSLEALHAEQRHAILAAIIFVAAFLVLGAFLSFRFARSICLPLEQVTSTIRAISETRDLGKRVVGGTEVVELHVLQDKFNQLLGEIEASQDRRVENERLMKELEIASSIQAALLPAAEALQSAHYEVFASMQPAAEVGGDYYDILQASDDRLWLGIGDVSGHGLTAGLYMMMAQSAVVSFLRGCPQAGPKALAVNLNATLYENMRRRFKADDFFTACFLVLDPAGRVLFSGKHLPIVVYRQSTRTCEVIDTQGTWMGIMPDIDPLILEESFQLERGDLVLLYTDGLIESRNATSQQFDMAGLLHAVERHCRPDRSVAEIGRQILGEQERFIDGRPPDDDISLIVVRKT